MPRSLVVLFWLLLLLPLLSSKRDLSQRGLLFPWMLQLRTADHELVISAMVAAATAALSRCRVRWR